MPIMVFLGISILDLGPMYVTDVRRQPGFRQTGVRQKDRLMTPLIMGGGIIN